MIFGGIQLALMSFAFQAPNISKAIGCECEDPSFLCFAIRGYQFNCDTLPCFWLDTQMVHQMNLIPFGWLLCS